MVSPSSETRWLLSSHDCRYVGAMTKRTDIKTRNLWTLELAGRESRSGLDTLDDLAVVLAHENLPGVAPPEWIVAALQMDEDDDGASSHASASGWSLQVKRMSSVVAVDHFSTSETAALSCSREPL